MLSATAEGEAECECADDGCSAVWLRDRAVVIVGGQCLHMREAVFSIDSDVGDEEDTFSVDQNPPRFAGVAVRSRATEVILDDCIDGFSTGEYNFGLCIFEVGDAVNAICASGFGRALDD